MSGALLTVPLTADLVRGAVELEDTGRGLQPHRLPSWVRARHRDAQLAMTQAQPSGVRVVLRTSASVIELDTLRTVMSYVGAPPRPEGVYDLLVDGELVAGRSVDGGNVLRVDMTTGSVESIAGEPGTIRFEGLPARPKVVEVWLPHNEMTLLMALRADAPVEAVGDTGRRRWVHHGSSISHGSSAERPTGTWPALAAAAGGVDLLNLGLGGSALLDPFVARVVRDTPADLISLKLGINLVNTDLLRRRALGPAVHGYLDTIRDGHPDTPLLVVSPILCPIHERTPGPSLPDLSGLAQGRIGFRAGGDPADVAGGRLSLEVIRDELADVVAQRAPHDPHLHLLHGTELYGEADVAALPLPDDLHPDAATHRLMGRRFAEMVFAPGGAFAVATT